MIDPVGRCFTITTVDPTGPHICEFYSGRFNQKIDAGRLNLDLDNLGGFMIGQ